MIEEAALKPQKQLFCCKLICMSLNIHFYPPPPYTRPITRTRAMAALKLKVLIDFPSITIPIYT